MPKLNPHEWIDEAIPASFPYVREARTVFAGTFHETLRDIEALPCTTERDWREAAQLPAGTHDERDTDSNTWNLH